MRKQCVDLQSVGHSAKHVWAMQAVNNIVEIQFDHYISWPKNFEHNGQLTHSPRHYQQRFAKAEDLV